MLGNNWRRSAQTQGNTGALTETDGVRAECEPHRPRSGPSPDHSVVTTVSLHRVTAAPSPSRHHSPGQGLLLLFPTFLNTCASAPPSSLRWTAGPTTRTRDCSGLSSGLSYPPEAPASAPELREEPGKDVANFLSWNALPGIVHLHNHFQGRAHVP